MSDEQQSDFWRRVAERDALREFDSEGRATVSPSGQRLGEDLDLSDGGVAAARWREAVDRLGDDAWEPTRCAHSPDGYHAFATPTAERCMWCGW